MKGAASPKVPISAGRQCRRSFGNGSGASREEAPEESVFLSATRFLGYQIFFGRLGNSVSEAGRKRGRPKKGRGTSDGVAANFGLRQAGQVERSAILRVADR